MVPKYHLRSGAQQTPVPPALYNTLPRPLFIVCLLIHYLFISLGAVVPGVIFYVIFFFMQCTSLFLKGLEWIT